MNTLFKIFGGIGLVWAALFSHQPSLGNSYPVTGGVSTSTSNTFTVVQQFSGGLTNASNTHIGSTYSQLVSKVAGEGDTTDIQTAITADCALANPGEVFVKNGTYALGATGLTIPSTCSGIQIVGESESSTNITYSGTGAAVNLGDLSGSIHDCTFENFTIIGTSAGHVGLNNERTQVCNVQNIYITGFTTQATTTALQGTGMILSGGANLLADDYFSNIHMDHNDLDILIASTSNANYFVGLDLYGQSGPSSTLIRIQNGVGNTLGITNLSSATYGIDCRTQRNIVFMGYTELLNTAVQMNSSCTNNEFHFEQMANVTTTFAGNTAALANVLFSSNEGTTLSTTTVLGNVNIFGGNFTVTSTAAASIALYRGTTSNFAGYHLGDNGTNWWAFQMPNDSTDNVQIGDEQDGGKILVGRRNASTTIGVAGTGTGIQLDHPVAVNTNGSSSILIGNSASSTHGCLELYDAVNTTTIDYIYASSTALVITTTKPFFCN